MKNKTISIVFHGGSYGTYLEWVLTTLMNKEEIIEPFFYKGNSHGFNGHHLLNMDGWRRYLSGEKNFQIVRFHPKTLKNENLCDNIAEISRYVDKFIYLYPDEDTFILGLHNQYTKVWKDWWQKNLIYDIDPSLIYENWPVDKTTPIDKVPTWIRREFLSYYMIPMWESQIGWGDTNQFGHANCYVIKLKDLLYNFPIVLKNIKNFFGFTFVNSVEQILKTHEKMLSLQTHLDIDIICRQIIKSVISSEHYAWDPISMIGEVWIQWQLRNLGYEIRCHNLDIFPCDSVKLKELIYKSS